MKILSFNARGVRDAPKTISLKGPILIQKHDIILFQETMCLGVKSRLVMESWLNGWSFYIVDVEGISRRQLIVWSSLWRDLYSSVLSSSISVSLELKYLGTIFKVVNIYGPHLDRVSFWENLVDVGVSSDPMMIVGGDLNFRTSLKEVWGPSPWLYSKGIFFQDFMEKHHLVDLEKIKLMPT
jgi:hypothetical protein